MTLSLGTDYLILVPAFKLFDEIIRQFPVRCVIIWKSLVLKFWVWLGNMSNCGFRLWICAWKILIFLYCQFLLLHVVCRKLWFTWWYLVVFVLLRTLLVLFSAEYEGCPKGVGHWFWPSRETVTSCWSLGRKGWLSCVFDCRGCWHLSFSTFIEIAGNCGVTCSSLGLCFL